MKYVISACCAGLLFIACRKMEVPAPVLQIKPESMQYHVNDTVRFSIGGNAANITFYSGEDGHRYEKKGEVTIVKGTPRFEFKSVTAGGPRANSLKLLVTSDMGTLSADRLMNTTWLDVTSRATLATSTAGAASGIIELPEFAGTDKPLRIAFKYEAASSPTLTQPIWAINSYFNVSTVFPDGTVIPVITLTKIKWTAFDIKNPLAQWTITPAQIRIDGGKINSPDNEDWIVTDPLDLQAGKEVTDLGVPVKSIGSSEVSRFEHVYTKPGTYRVTFVGFNNSIDSHKSVIQQFEIVVSN